MLKSNSYFEYKIGKNEMKYWLVPSLFVMLAMGCGSSYSSDTPSTSSSNDTSINISNTSANITLTDYSLMQCESELKNALTLINQLRMQDQTCGDTRYPAAKKVAWSNTLTLVASKHSHSMANKNFFSHTGLDGSNVGARVTTQGYPWRIVSENIAAGQISVQEVVNGWMLSEGHCRNIMNPSVTEMGLACYINSESDYKRYWTQVFAKPR